MWVPSFVLILLRNLNTVSSFSSGKYAPSNNSALRQVIVGTGGWVGRPVKMQQLLAQCVWVGWPDMRHCAYRVQYLFRVEDIFVPLCVCSAHRCMESPGGTYTQLIPSMETNSRHTHRHRLPPSLPPQLLQVLLNNDSSQANFAAVQCSLLQPPFIFLQIVGFIVVQTFGTVFLINLVVAHTTDLVRRWLAVHWVATNHAVLRRMIRLAKRALCVADHLFGTLCPRSLTVMQLLYAIWNHKSYLWNAYFWSSLSLIPSWCVTSHPDQLILPSFLG